MNQASTGTARHAIESVCRVGAMIGSVGLVAIMMVVVTSVLGSNLLRTPILGDTEIVDSLTGITVFCFLPYCHLRGGNVVVDFFAKPLPPRARDWLDVVMGVAFAAVAGVITWRLMAGGISAYMRDQRSMFLEIPEWIAYAVGSVACLAWIAVILFVAYESMLKARGLVGHAADKMHFG